MTKYDRGGGTGRKGGHKSIFQKYLEKFSVGSVNGNEDNMTTKMKIWILQFQIRILSNTKLTARKVDNESEVDGIY
jgi:hypothetical protein